jgi:membrane-bound serine protease (ClpP class)
MALVISLLLAGALLLFLETVLPGLIAGVIGFICIVIAIAIGYAQFDFQTANLLLAGTIAALIGGAILYIKYFPESRAARLFVSRRVVGEIGTENPSLLNQTGQTLTALRPSGKAILNGQRLDVISEGAFIEAGQAVKVVTVEGLRVVVRPV